MSVGKEKINVLSLFDGISCGQIALERAGIDVENYFSSEIDEDAIKTSDKKTIEKSILQALNKASSTNKDVAASKMKELTSGMKIPGLGDLF